MHMNLCANCASHVSICERACFVCPKVRDTEFFMFAHAVCLTFPRIHTRLAEFALKPAVPFQLAQGVCMYELCVCVSVYTHKFMHL